MATSGAGSTGVDSSGTKNIPPHWTPGSNYAFRDYERDLANWCNLTDLGITQRGPAVYQRLGGMAKVLAREIPDEVLANGYPDSGLTGLQVLMNALRKRWGAETQSQQLELIRAYDDFRVSPTESIDDALTRFDIIQTRASSEAGHVSGFTARASKLLSAFRVPEEQWALLLAPTQGALPSTDEQYLEFSLYLKRHLSLFFNRSNIAHPVPPGMDGKGGKVYMADGRDIIPDPPPPYGQGPHRQSDMGIFASRTTGPTSYSQCRTCAHTLECYNCNPATYDDEADLLDSESETDDDGRYDDISKAEHIYLEYEQAMCEWDNLDMPPEVAQAYETFLAKAQAWNRFRRGARRQHQGRSPHRRSQSAGAKPHRRPRFKMPPRRRHTYAASVKNPMGKDGKIMTCSICGSEEHFRAYCDKKPKFHGAKPNHSKRTAFATGTYTFVDDNPGTDAGPSPGSSIDNVLGTGAEPTIETKFQDTSHLWLPWWVDNSSDDQRRYINDKHSPVCLPGKREGVMIDTGAHDNLSGRDWVNRQTETTHAAGRDGRTTSKALQTPMMISGIGDGSQQAREELTVPVCMGSQPGHFRTPVVDGSGSGIPGIWGLKSMTKQDAIIDTRGHGAVILPGPGGISMTLSPGSTVLHCERSATGHMFIPTNDWSKLDPKAQPSKVFMQYSSYDRSYHPNVSDHVEEMRSKSETE